MPRLRWGLGVLAILMFVTPYATAGNLGPNPYRLIEKWQTSRALRVPESVLYDEAHQVLYVMIYKLEQGRMTAWLVNKAINKPNGLYLEETRLIVGNSGDGTIKAINLKNKKVTAIAKVGSGIDGLRSDGKGNYFISDWKGRTSLVTGDGQIIVLMDTTAAGINAADLEYIQANRLLIIPTFFDNRVVAYEVKKKE